MKKFVITSQARRDLRAIWNYIAAESSDATANRILAEFYNAIVLLAEWPKMGHARRDVENPRYRFWNVYNYIIAYRTDRTPLTIARVVHGSRNMRRMFK